MLTNYLASLLHPSYTLTSEPCRSFRKGGQRSEILWLLSRKKWFIFCQITACLSRLKLSNNEWIYPSQSLKQYARRTPPQTKMPTTLWLPNKESTSSLSYTHLNFSKYYPLSANRFAKVEVFYELRKHFFKNFAPNHFIINLLAKNTICSFWTSCPLFFRRVCKVNSAFCKSKGSVKLISLTLCFAWFIDLTTRQFLSFAKEF
jgi:hypothetical protein